MQAVLGAQKISEEEDLSKKIAKEMESIMRLRSTGKILNLSDKFSDILTIDFLLRSSDRFRNKTYLEKERKVVRRKDTISTQKTSLPDSEETYSSTEKFTERMIQLENQKTLNGNIFLCNHCVKNKQRLLIGQLLVSPAYP